MSVSLLDLTEEGRRIGLLEFGCIVGEIPDCRKIPAKSRVKQGRVNTAESCAIRQMFHQGEQRSAQSGGVGRLDGAERLERRARIALKKILETGCQFFHPGFRGKHDDLARNAVECRWRPGDTNLFRRNRIPEHILAGAAAYGGTPAPLRGGPLNGECIAEAIIYRRIDLTGGIDVKPDEPGSLTAAGEVMQGDACGLLAGIVVAVPVVNHLGEQFRCVCQNQ